MNNERRKALTALAEKIRELTGAIEEAVSDLEGLRDEEQEYKDNMPESFQNGEKGEAADAAVSAMEDALSDLENIDLGGIADKLDEAAA